MSDDTKPLTAEEREELRQQLGCGCGALGGCPGATMMRLLSDHDRLAARVAELEAARHDKETYVLQTEAALGHAITRAEAAERERDALRGLLREVAEDWLRHAPACASAADDKCLCGADGVRARVAAALDKEER